MKRGKGSIPLTEIQIKEAQRQSLSAFEASRTLGVAYNTYKKYARQYGIMEDLKNPYGIGIYKNGFNINRKRKLSSDELAIRIKRKELRDRHLHKYYNEFADIDYGCGLYIITIPKGNDRVKYIKKWGTLPVKIGISKDVVNRYFKLILQKTYVCSNEEKWVEWNNLVEIINVIPFYTTQECEKVESRIHSYIRDYRVQGIKNSTGGTVLELFEAPFEKINEAIETYVTGWRTLKWDSNEMNNEYIFW
jgi:hypothetical protein